MKSYVRVTYKMKHDNFIMLLKVFDIYNRNDQLFIEQPKEGPSLWKKSRTGSQEPPPFEMQYHFNVPSLEGQIKL